MQRAYSFGHNSRLHGRLQFAAVFAGRVRQQVGPLMLYALARENPAAQLRLGISIGRPVGIAARRNRIKRLLREAFRLIRPELPTGYDLVIVVRPHAPLELPQYQSLLREAVARLHRRPKSRQPPANP